MLISESHRFLFVHVQKTAGTSVTQLLAPYALPSPAGRLRRTASDFGLVRNWRRHHFRIHAPLRRAERILPRDVFESMFKFGFVRNPWDRLVSWYVYIFKETGHRRHARVQGRGGFEAFVHAELAHPRRSQWWMVARRDGELGLDFVGRFENLEDDMSSICRRLSIPCQPLPRANISRHEPYQSYYTPALAALVRQRWAREIEAFGYSFG